MPGELLFQLQGIFHICNHILKTDSSHASWVSLFHLNIMNQFAIIMWYLLMDAKKDTPKSICIDKLWEFVDSSILWEW